MDLRRVFEAGKFLVALSALSISATATAQEGMRKVQVESSWPTVFEANRGESLELVTQAGSTRVKLLEIEHAYEPDHVTGKSAENRTFLSARLKLEVDGKPAELWLRGYQMPTTVGHVRLSVENTAEWANSGGLGNRRRMEHDVRLSAVPAGQTWGPADLRFPIKDYRWRSSTYRNSWSALVPFNVLYYHRGEDFGAIPNKLELVAVLPGTIAATPLPNGDGRSNSISLDVGDGTQIRYAHMDTESVDPKNPVGTQVESGTVLAKTGMTWNGGKNQHNDPHLHIELAQNGQTINMYASIVEAYFRDYDDTLIAIAGGFGFATPGQTYDLDATRSVARPGRSIRSYQWTLHDGTVVKGPHAKVKFDKPGYYAQELTVIADNGDEDRDSIHICVIDPANGGGYGSGWVYYTPTRNITPGTPVTFRSRLASSDQTIDFGDGSKPKKIEGDLDYAFEKPGIYTVSIRGASANGSPILHKIRIRIDPAPSARKQ